MHMRAGRAAARAHESDRLAAGDGIPDGDERAFVVGVARGETVAVADLDQLAVAGAHARPGHDPGCDGDDFIAQVPCEIDALVNRLLPGEWVLPLTEVG